MPNVHEDCYLKLTPDREDGEVTVPHRNEGIRRLSLNGTGKYALRTPTETEEEDVFDICEFLRDHEVSVTHYYDTSNPFLAHSSDNNFRGVYGNDLARAREVLEDFGLRYQVLDVTPYRFLTALTVGQLVVERPRCGCSIEQLRDRGGPCEHASNGEIEGGPAEFLPTLSELREELDAPVER